MSYRTPYPAGEAVIGIGVGIILSILTCGLYGLYWQYKQIEVLNAWLGREEYDFWVWLLLSLVTCGLYALYYEYTMAKGINEIQEVQGLRVNDDLALLCVLLAAFGFGIASLAIQQSEINKLYGETRDI